MKKKGLLPKPSKPNAIASALGLPINMKQYLKKQERRRKAQQQLEIDIITHKVDKHDSKYCPECAVFIRKLDSI